MVRGQRKFSYGRGKSDPVKKDLIYSRGHREVFGIDRTELSGFRCVSGLVFLILLSEVKGKNAKS